LLLCRKLLAPHVAVAAGVAPCTEIVDDDRVIVELRVGKAHGKDGLKGVGG
jgi:hypothetical protein